MKLEIVKATAKVLRKPEGQESNRFYDECEYCHGKQGHDSACPKFIEPAVAHSSSAPAADPQPQSAGAKVPEGAGRAGHRRKGLRQQQAASTRVCYLLLLC